MKLFNKLTLLVMLLSILSTGCSKKKKNHSAPQSQTPYGPNYGRSNYGPGIYCQLPPGNARLERTVRGDFGMAGAYIDMEIYSDAGDAVYAVGMLSISDMSQIHWQAPQGAPFQTCISGSGSIRRFSNISDEITMVMQGEQGTRVEMGQNGAITTLAGNRLNGMVYMTVQGSDVLLYTLTP